MSSPGEITLEGLSFVTKTPGSRPYCHFCKHVTSIVVYIRTENGNPRRACRNCVETGGVPELPFEKNTATRGFDRLALDQMRQTG